VQSAGDDQGLDDADVLGAELGPGFPALAACSEALGINSNADLKPKLDKSSLTK
jgi:hypothetical protein